MLIDLFMRDLWLEDKETVIIIALSLDTPTYRREILFANVEACSRHQSRKPQNEGSKNS